MATAAALVVLTLAGCSYAPDWSEYEGPAVMKGSGGMMHVVAGIEIWNYGTPPRSYRVLGMMHSQGGGHSDIDFETEQIAKAARAKGADAIIIESAESEPTGMVGSENGRSYTGPFGATNYSGVYSGHLVRSPSVDAIVIKYL